MTKDPLLLAQQAIEPLHQKKKKPKAGDWLAENKDEPRQSFRQFKSLQQKPHQKNRNIFYLQPIGHFSEPQLGLIEKTRDAMSIFFGKETRVLSVMSMDVIPGKARRTHQRELQLLSGYILKLLRRAVPKDAISVLALTSNDLWPGEGWNFVFGEASLTERVGVWSLFRYGDPESELCLQRTLKVAIHETGHMLGMEHCIAYECGMNGSNHLDEMDQTPLPFCSECERKIWWFLEVDPVARYEKLVTLADSFGLKTERDFWQSSLTALTQNFKA